MVRAVTASPTPDAPPESERAVVIHDFYGCDTGCCGHTIVIYRGTTEVRRKFEFDHPGREGSEQFARDFVAQYNAKMGSAAVLDYSACEISDD